MTPLDPPRRRVSLWEKHMTEVLRLAEKYDLSPEDLEWLAARIAYDRKSRRMAL